MKREGGVYVFAVLIVLAAFLTVYYLNVETTGFAVFEQNTQAAFDEGIYSNVLYDANTSTVIVSPNQTSGTYTSKVFDSADNSTIWDELKWEGAAVDFEVRSCSVPDCSDTNFTTPSNLSNLNISGKYFQYKASFDSVNDSLIGVTIDYTAPVVTSVSILNPSGSVDTQSTIPLEYTATGTGLQCSYNVIGSDGSQEVANTTLSNCSNSEFDVSGDGDYIITVFANGSSGYAVSSVSFLVSTGEEEEAAAEEDEEPVVEEAPIEQATETPTTGIAVTALATQEIIQGSSKDLALAVQNTGNQEVTSCVLTGDDSGWVAVTSAATSIAGGANANFAFSVTVPEETPVATYTLSLSVTCAEISADTGLGVNVFQKKIDLNITNIQRTREDRVSVDYTITELIGEDQDLEIYFSIKDSAGTELANASQNRSVDANETDDFRTNVPINETLNGTMTLSVAFNSQTYSSSVLEPVDLTTVTGAAILGGIGTGSLVVVAIVALALGGVFFAAKRMRESKGKSSKSVSSKSE